MDSSFLAHSSHFFWALSFNAIRPHSTHFNVMTTPPRTRRGNVPARGNLQEANHLLLGMEKETLKEVAK
jgi:hypothetical protein